MWDFDRFSKNRLKFIRRLNCFVAFQNYHGTFFIMYNPWRRIRKFCHNVDFTKRTFCDQIEWNNARPYSKIPGVKPLPILGNKWRSIPVIGKYIFTQINIIIIKIKLFETFYHLGSFDTMHIDKAMENIYHEYGDCAKFPKFIDDRDALFLFNPNDVEKVSKTEVDR